METYDSQIADTREAPATTDILFEEVDLFSTALIQGGCTNSAPF